MVEKRKKPLTREDVLRLIKENGGTTEGLDLSGKVFEEAIDLSDLDIRGIILNNARLFRANFNGSNLDRAIMLKANLGYVTFNPLQSKAASLQGVDLKNADLTNAEFQEADLTAAQFQEHSGLSILPAYLNNTDFRGANLFHANFKGCYFYGTKLEGAFIRGADILEAHLEETDWSSYVIGEEIEGDFCSAESIYRRLKTWYKNAGISDIAAKFYYREREAARKGAKRWNDRAAGWLAWALFGHGEGWKRILFWIAGVILAFTLVYFVIGTFIPNLGTLTPNTFLNSLYYSAVSFTALGYGSWAPEPAGWVKGLGSFEALLGISMMALLLVTFVRKWTR